MARRLVDETLAGLAGYPPTMPEIGAAPGSWIALSLVHSFALPEIEDDADEDAGSDAAELPYFEETQASQGAALFSGTRGDVRDQEPPPPMVSWKLQPPAPAPPSGRSGSQPPAVVDDYLIFYEDDPEEYQALDRARRS